MSLVETIIHLFHPRRSNNHRARILHPESIFSLTLITIGFMGLLQMVRLVPGLGGHILGFASNITPAQVVELTNQERKNAGLAPLTLNSQLSQAALAKGQDMFTDQYWAHTAPDGTEPWTFIRNAGYGYQAAGENLARDFSNSSDMMTAWMASPTHKANIMSGRYKEIGVAVIDGNLQGIDTTLVVQMFGTPRQTAAKVSEEGSVTVVPAKAPAPAQAPIKKVAEQPVPTAAASPVPTTEPALIPQPVVAPEATEVLGGVLVPRTQLQVPPLFSPLQLSKAFFLAIIMILILTLVYDGLVIGHRSAMRVVGKNVGHIVFLTAVAFLVIFFKGGIVN